MRNPFQSAFADCPELLVTLYIIVVVWQMVNP